MSGLQEQKPDLEEHDSAPKAERNRVQTLDPESGDQLNCNPSREHRKPDLEVETYKKMLLAATRKGTLQDAKNHKKSILDKPEGNTNDEPTPIKSNEEMIEDAKKVAHLFHGKVEKE